MTRDQLHLLLARSALIEIIRHRGKTMERLGRVEELIEANNALIEREREHKYNEAVAKELALTMAQSLTNVRIQIRALEKELDNVIQFSHSAAGRNVLLARIAQRLKELSEGMSS